MFLSQKAFKIIFQIDIGVQSFQLWALKAKALDSNFGIEWVTDY